MEQKMNDEKGAFVDEEEEEEEDWEGRNTVQFKI